MEQEPASPIRKARIRLGLTLSQVAERCTDQGVPISEGQVSRIERGHAAGRPETRVALAGILGLDAYGDFEKVECASANPNRPANPSSPAAPAERRTRRATLAAGTASSLSDEAV